MWIEIISENEAAVRFENISDADRLELLVSIPNCKFCSSTNEWVVNRKHLDKNLMSKFHMMCARLKIALNKTPPFVDLLLTTKPFTNTLNFQH